MTPIPKLSNQSRLSNVSIRISIFTLVLMAIMLWAATAQAILTRPNSGQSFGPSGTGPGTFSSVVGVAVDQGTGDVFVYDGGEGGRVYKFNATGEPVSFSASATNVISGVGSVGGAEGEIAVDSSSGPDGGDIYVANLNEGAVHIYGASGAFLGELTGGAICGVAVDPSGAVYVGVYPQIVRKYTPIANPVVNADETASINGLEGVCNVAADSKGDVYTAVPLGGVSRYDASQFGSLTPTSTPIGEQEVHIGALTVDPSTDNVVVNYVSHIEEYDSSGLPLASFGSGELSGSFGVAVKGGAGGVMYVPTSGRVQIFGAAVTVAAKLQEESFSEVGSSSATLDAQVNSFGLLSKYYYEYGTSSSYGSVTPETSLGKISGYTGAPAQLSGLQPNTTYHFRIVVTNDDGTTRGTDLSFSTLPMTIAGLPDERVYEMVTPPSNQDANVYAPGPFPGEDTSSVHTRLPFQVSPDGSVISYAADPTSGGNGSDGEGGGNEYVATRSSSGWTQLDVQPPGDHTAVYQAFSNDLSLGFLDACDSTPLSAAAPSGEYDVLYSHVPGSNSYVPLYTKTPQNRSREEFRTVNVLALSLWCKSVAYAGSSSDDGHILFAANDALTAAATLNPPTQEENDLYDSTGGQLNIVNVLPGASAVVEPNATFGSFTPSSFSVDFNHVISADGSRIFWTDLNTGDLYVRKDSGTATASTVQVDASVGGGGVYWTASTTGSLVFFTKGGDLYVFDTDTNQTTDLAPQGEVQGVVDASDDGSYIYYVGDAAVATGASAGQPNLYMRRHEAGGWAPPVFIATLSPSDDTNQSGDWRSDLGARTAETTPDGHSLVFVSKNKLTSYDTNSVREVYVYDADTKELICSSCIPSGEASTDAASLTVTENQRYMLRWISADGDKVFFDDSAPLVPDDTNGNRDVYEWERDGAGGCLLSRGCLFLLSGGNSTVGSYFADASLSGNDVFIVTRAQLTATDQNGNMDLYDVRAGGVQQPSPSACSGSGCQGVPPAPPIFATPSSVTFNGVGNFSPPSKVVKQRSKSPTRARRLSQALKVCAKKQKRKQATCRTLARKRYGARSKAKKSTKGRK
jgi:Tol biopolymer transport system component